MPTIARTYGAATIKPISTVLLTPALRSMEGIQNANVMPVRKAKFMNASSQTSGDRKTSRMQWVLACFTSSATRC
ncbi:hypothetical protein D3C78_764690 [compost metagenome]